MRTEALSSLLAVVSVVAASPSVAAAPPSTPIASVTLADDAAKDAVLRFARDALATPEVLDADPTLVRASDLAIHAFSFGDARVVRVVPSADGVPVEGADRKILVDGKRRARFVPGAPLATTGRFDLSAVEAVAKGAERAHAPLFTDVTVEDTAFFARRVYLARGDHVRAAWRVRIPTFRVTDAKDVWVDAETGAILKERFVAMAADGGVADGGELVDGGDGADGGEIVDAGEPVVDAGEPVVDAGEPVVDAGPLPPAPTATRIFSWWPNPGGVTPLDLVDHTLTGLIDAEVGGPLLGGHFETRNCCKQFVCRDGTTDCSMNDPIAARCADDDDFDPIEATIAVEIPTDFLSLPVEDFEILYAKSVFCAELPRALSKPASGGDPAGFFESPVDQPRFPNELLGLASEEDAFAELQAYAATSAFFAHVRDTIDDDTFCLRDLSMACEADGSPSLGPDGRPIMPFRVTVNALRPEIDIEAIFLQLLPPQSRGRDPGNPVVVDEYARENQAVFLPALSSGPIGIPPELSVIAEIFTRDFDSTIYFQGERDFSYDGSIVFHEFSHAVIHTLKPELEQYGHDEQGGHAMPGALNEGFADYFSASFSGEPQVGQYGAAGFLGGETGLRDLSEPKVCPDDTAGEVHDDSEPFSSALWAIRETIVATVGASAVKDYDQLLWAAIAAADDDETHPAMAARISAAIETAFGASVRNTADGIFEDHGVSSCERVFALTGVSSTGTVAYQTKERLYLPTAGQLGLSSMAPATVQFRVEVPPATAGFRLNWDQASLIDESFGGEPVQLSVMVFEDDAPAEWQYQGSEADSPVPFRASGQQIVFNPTPIPSRADMSDPAKPFYNVVVDVDPCEKKVFHAVFINIEGATPIASNIAVELIPATDAPACEESPDAGDGDGDGDGDDDDDVTDPPVCGCDATGDGESGGAFALAALVVVGALVRRRRR